MSEVRSEICLADIKAFFDALLLILAGMFRMTCNGPSPVERIPECKPLYWEASTADGRVVAGAVGGVRVAT